MNKFLNKKIKIKSKARTILAFSLIVAGFGGSVFQYILRPTYAATSTCAKITNVYTRKECYAKEAAAAAKAADEKKKQAEAVKVQMTKIDGQIDDTKGSISTLSDQISVSETKISELKTKITALEEDLALQKSKMESLVSSWYMEGEDGLLSVLLGSDNVSKVVDKQEQYDSIKSQIQETTDRMNQAKKELSDQKQIQEDERARLNGMKGEAESQQKDLENQQWTKQRLLTDTNNMIKELTTQEQDALKKEQEAQGEIRRMEEAASRGSSWLRSGSSARGFMWPLENPTMGCGFGYSSCYFTGVFHSGVDLKKYLYAPVYASKAGQVVAVVDGVGNTYPYSKSYGNYVKIRHDGGVYTLYGHMVRGSITVNIGDSVGQGQKIGELGSTGFSTGPHLHFELRGPDDVPVDPVPSMP